MRRPALSLPLSVLTCLLLFAAPTWAADLTIGPLPADAPAGFDAFFTKHVHVLGAHVYATADTPDAKVRHAATILAEYLDNDEDGRVDDDRVARVLRSRHASLVMWPSESAFERSSFDDVISDRVFDTTSIQPLFGGETNPGYPGNRTFDWALEECLHLVTFGGWSRAYPDVFGEEPGTDVAQAMDLSIANGFFHYDDPTCDYACLVSEYTYWALTSLLGAQDYPWRVAEIADEWELYSAALVRREDPAFTALFDDARFALPKRLPDGSYAAEGEGNDGEGDGEGDGGGEDEGGGAGPCGSVACLADDHTLCLNGGRFAAQATFADPADGQTKAARVEQLTSDTGYFYFFSQTNVEAFAKVLDACGLNQSYWVFAGGLTGLEMEIRVCDTQKGVLRTYENPEGPFRTVNDTAAFPTSCP